MYFWFVVWIISFVGILLILIPRLFKSQDFYSIDEEEVKRQVSERADILKKRAYEVAISSSKVAQKGFSKIYKKGMSSIQNTNVSNLVNGKGILKQKDITSDFLRDVKEHKEKVREGLKNGDAPGKVGED